MVTSVIFLIKKNKLNRHIKHENSLSIYENVDYFQIMSITNLEWFCINCSILEVGVTSHAQIRHVVLGCLASFSLFIMFNLCACNVCENRCTITKITEST